MSTIFNLPNNEMDAISFFQERGILPDKLVCEKGHEMKLYVDKTIWRCNIKSCKKKKGLRVGNWFSGSRLPFVTALRFMYCWAEALTSIKWCHKQLNMCESATIYWNNYMREVCSLHVMQRFNGRIGGPNKIVEIDQSWIVWRKNSGKLLPQQWIFGGICRENGECFLVQIANRDASTLMEKILGHVQDGSTIYSDCLKGYKVDELEEAGYSHFTVNHKYNFVDPTTDIHTQNIRKMWGTAKWRNKKQRGTTRHHFESNLAEFMWRKYIGKKNGFDELLKAISEIWSIM